MIFHCHVSFLEGSFTLSVVCLWFPFSVVSSKCKYIQALPDLFSDTKKLRKFDLMNSRIEIQCTFLRYVLHWTQIRIFTYPRFHGQFQRYGCITLGVTLKNLNHRELGAFWDFFYYLSHTVPLVSFVFVLFWPKDNIVLRLWLSQLSAGGSSSISYPDTNGFMTPDSWRTSDIFHP